MHSNIHPTRYPETDDDDADAEDALGEAGGMQSENMMLMINY